MSNDPRFLFEFLKSDPRTEIKCHSCQGRLGNWIAKVGLTLTTGFDIEALDFMIQAKPFAYVSGHGCGLVQSEIDDTMRQATEWAERIFAERARQWEQEQEKLLLLEQTPLSGPDYARLRRRILGAGEGEYGADNKQEGEGLGNAGDTEELSPPDQGPDGKAL